MFEFEKRIMKINGDFPMAGYPYKVIPLTEEAKYCFARYTSGNPHRLLSSREIKSFIKEKLNVETEPFIGIVKFHADADARQVEMLARNLILKNMAGCSVPGIAYADEFGMSKRHVLLPLQCDKDFTIELGEKITYEPPKKLSFDDIKAL